MEGQGFIPATKAARSALHLRRFIRSMFSSWFEAQNAARNPSSYIQCFPQRYGLRLILAFVISSFQFRISTFERRGLRGQGYFENMLRARNHAFAGRSARRRMNQGNQYEP